jgi:putative FmdB family regulatory protein
MPIYEYQPKGKEHCDFCAAGFELLRKISDPPLTECPQCSAPVIRKISAPNLGSSGPALNESNIEKHGFTQYRKLEKGVYEKTAGKGPDLISDD